MNTQTPQKVRTLKHQRKYEHSNTTENMNTQTPQKIRTLKHHRKYEHSNTTENMNTQTPQKVRTLKHHRKYEHINTTQAQMLPSPGPHTHKCFHPQDHTSTNASIPKTTPHKTIDITVNQALPTPWPQPMKNLIDITVNHLRPQPREEPRGSFKHTGRSLDTGWACQPGTHNKPGYPPQGDHLLTFFTVAPWIGSDESRGLDRTRVTWPYTLYME